MRQGHESEQTPRKRSRRSTEINFGANDEKFELVYLTTKGALDLLNVSRSKFYTDYYPILIRDDSTKKLARSLYYRKDRVLALFENLGGSDEVALRSLRMELVRNGQSPRTLHVEGALKKAKPREANYTKPNLQMALPWGVELEDGR